MGGLPADKRLRENLVDLYSSNSITGQRTQSIVNDAADAGLDAFNHLVGPVGKNSKRNLSRKLMKNKKWPPLYYADVRVKQKGTEKIVKKKMGFLLPHELISIAANYNPVLMDQSKLSEENKQHVQLAASTWGVDSGSIIPCGLWIDGTPCNWDRSDSLENVCLNFPGVAGHASLRIPLASITKRHCTTAETFDDILAVITWSFQILRGGEYPSMRHDGTKFKDGQDKYRMKHKNQKLHHALLCEVRGDWKMYKDVLRLPGWQEAESCCNPALHYFFLGKQF